jgi:cellulose synthase/poly-beta-1,6-N-acetylglucosamine synthase-like glycosyltransferase
MSTTLLDIAAQALTLLGLVLLVPASVLLAQVLAALLPARGERESSTQPASRPCVAVLVPAHNESVGIAATLHAIRLQLAPDDRLLVVADNCSDDTARAAAAGGAEVVERTDAAHRGKGYALDFGIRHLETAPPDVVLVVDADCELHAGSIERLARRCAEGMRPVQALDLMRAPPGAGLKSRIAEFAWLVKNQVRPLGYRRLGLPCQLMGTGMAFPWSLIRNAPLASGHIVEDVRLGLDLAAAGTPPLFCPQALVTSVFPSHPQGIADQRARWEQGHVGVIVQDVPRALWRALACRRPALAAMALDVCVPPLTLFVLLLLVQAATDAVVFAVGGARTPLGLALVALAMVILATGLAWLGFGRRIVSLGDLLSAPLYVLAKMPLYARFFRRGKSEWVRARRDERSE